MSKYSFLQAVARAYSRESAKCSFIFPSRRAAKFFQRYLAQEYFAIYQKPLISPRMITVGELFETLSGLEQADTLLAQYKLYECYAKIKSAAGQSVESFDLFYGWSSLIIKDFNDIDCYLADANLLFRNIADLKELQSGYGFMSNDQRKSLEQFWGVYLGGGASANDDAISASSGTGEIFDKKRSFGQLWEIMAELYKSFRAALLSSGVGYNGLIYRSVYDKLEQSNNNFDALVDQSYGRLVFIGFNAPNRCELAFMEAAKRAGRADFYWDFYGPMVTDPMNKSSLFIRECCGGANPRFPSLYNIEAEVSVPEQEFKKKRFEAVSVASGIGECYAARAILQEMIEEKKAALKQQSLSSSQREELAFSTAIVLPDSQLLIPLLNLIPDEFDKVNVTMGYPLQSTQLFSFLKLMGSLQLEMLFRDGKEHFYHKSLIALLEHNYFSQSKAAAALAESLLKGNIVYLPADSPLIPRGVQGEELLEAILKKCATTEQLCDWFCGVAALLEGDLQSDEKSLLYAVYQFVNRLKGLNLPLSTDLWIKIFVRELGQISVPFSGEPLAGLQIMGPLETRVLDFDNVIFLSANEGVFPSANVQQTLVPYNIRVAYGLPTYQLSDAISAYHFYRGIYRAKNVTLIYDSRTEGLSTGEITRYFKQLKYHYEVEIGERPFIPPVPLMSNIVAPVVEKDDVIVDKLKNLNYSASALNTYRDCPMKFFFSYVQKIRNLEVTESVGYDTFGTIFHLVMEELYKPYCQSIITANVIDAILQSNKIDALVEESIKSVMNISVVEGQNLMIKEVIKYYVELTLNTDKRIAQSGSAFKYLEGEKRYVVDYPVQLLGSTGNVVLLKLVGSIDRLDSLSGITRVVDYKTGKVDLKSNNSVRDLFDENCSADLKALFQTCFYALLYTRANWGGNMQNNLKLVIYALRDMKAQGLYEREITPADLRLFEEGDPSDNLPGLKNLFNEILNKSIPFQCKDWGGNHCEYCDYKDLCCL